MIELHRSEETNQLGFYFECVFITNPFLSECGRDCVEPIAYYGLNQSQINKLKEGLKT